MENFELLLDAAMQMAEADILEANYTNLKPEEKAVVPVSATSIVTPTIFSMPPSLNPISSVGDYRSSFRTIIDAFNASDISHFQQVLKNLIHFKIVIASKYFQYESVGLVPLMMLWMLILESYPDGTIAEDSIRVRELSANVIENTFVFMGSRITAETAVELYSTVTDILVNRDNKSMLQPRDMHTFVTRSSMKCSGAHMFIKRTGKVICTFDGNGKICKWDFDIKI